MPLRSSVVFGMSACLVCAPHVVCAADTTPKGAVQLPVSEAPQQKPDDAPSPSARAFDAALDQFNKGHLVLSTGLFYRFLHVDAKAVRPTRTGGSVLKAEADAADGLLAGDAEALDDEAPDETPADIALMASNVTWAHYFLGESLRGLGLHHAALVYYYEVIKQAADPALVPRALERLQDIVATRPFDTRLVYDNLLDATQFSSLSWQLSDWVEFEQGRRDIQRGFDRWGDKHLSNIDAKSPYAAHADYLRAVRYVRQDDDPNALIVLERIIHAPSATAEVLHMTQLALARLRFDKQDYAGALLAYAEVKPKHLSFEEGLVLTEKAWTHYYLGHVPEALGALHALAAPSYENFFYPDVYLLRALIYKERCHYLSAKDVTRSFRTRFAQTFEQLRARVPQQHIERIRRAAVMEGALAKRTQLLLDLTDERDRVHTILGVQGAKLVAHITNLYETAIDDNDQAWRRGFATAADAVSLRLLDTQEQINVLDYEVSLAIFKPIEDVDPKQLPSEQALAEAQVLDADRQAIYAFDGEYWNDELGDYQVVLPDLCLGEGP